RVAPSSLLASAMGKPLTALFGAIAVVLWGLGAYWAWKSWELWEHSVVVEGKVTEVVANTVTRRGVKTTTFVPLIEYAVSGTRYHIKQSVNDQYNLPAVGTVVAVRYRSEHPEDAAVDSFKELWLVPCVLGV